MTIYVIGNRVYMHPSIFMGVPAWKGETTGDTSFYLHLFWHHLSKEDKKEMQDLADSVDGPFEQFLLPLEY